MRATTPPAPSVRAHTPPTPLYGLAYDNYEPYSPRRSKRSTAQSNPYSSLNGERSPRLLPQFNTTPPATVKKARFARATTHLSSPPSSPVSPIKRHSVHKTPQKGASAFVRAANAVLSDSDAPSHTLHQPCIDPVTMLPTPSKTPKKRPAAALTGRILSFQPEDPNDVMPSPRKIRKQVGRPHTAATGFELYEDDASLKHAETIEIYTDANARVPEMDESEDNPFVGRRKISKRPQRRARKQNAEEVEREQLIDEAVKRDEGVTYVFRGKKIFRKFVDKAGQDGAPSAASDLSGTLEQRRLKHSAGAAAQRPLTRSAIKPRLLFPSEEQIIERQQGPDDVDEEADTDIEMSHVELSGSVGDNATTPVKDRFEQHLTPPPTHVGKRTNGKKRVDASPAASTPDEDVELTSAGVTDTFPASRFPRTRKAESPFDSWQRTKTGGVRKRAGEAVAESGEKHVGKRTRSALVESPA